MITKQDKPKLEWRDCKYNVRKSSPVAFVELSTVWDDGRYVARINGSTITGLGVPLRYASHNDAQCAAEHIFFRDIEKALNAAGYEVKKKE